MFSKLIYLEYKKEITKEKKGWIILEINIDKKFISEKSKPIIALRNKKKTVNVLILKILYCNCIINQNLFVILMISQMKFLSRRTKS